MKQVREELARLLSKPADLKETEIVKLLETPPVPEMGDIAFPCFSLAPKRRQPPVQIAKELAGELAKIEKPVLWERVAAAGPYLNFYINPAFLARQILQVIQDQGLKYGGSSRGRGQNIVIDYSSPNIAKPFGIGHLRSTVIGHSLYLICQSLGYRCIGINHLGDWGTQFGKLIVAYKKWGNDRELEKDPVDYLLRLYVEFHRRADEDPSLDEEARHCFKKLEEGDPEMVELWERFRRLSLDSYEEIYKVLGISFQYYHGESHYNNRLHDVIRLVEEKQIARESEGALVVDLEKFGLPPCMLRKKDGATLYITRDIAAAIYRYETFNFARMLYVVGAEQTLHFQQLFKILELLGFDWAKNCVHVPFGLIRFKDGRMSTREGKIILLEEVLQRAVNLAREIIEEKNPGMSNKEEAAIAVGIGAVRFGDLYNDRTKDVEFDWQKVLDLSGETAAYIQYAHARICSILRKSSDTPLRWDEEAVQLLQQDEEKKLLITLSLFPEKVETAADSFRPSIIARYLVEAARDFNRFYHNCPVLNSSPALQKGRLLLIDATRQVLANGLGLLGIAPLEEM